LSCRNLLIYLGPVLQERVIPVFHYALKPGGFLMLGTSETIGGFADLFALVDRKQKIYVKKAVTPRLPVDLSAGPLTIQEAAPRRRAGAAPLAGLQKEADQIVLARYGPPGVVVNDQLEILHFRGKTGRYLEPASGEAALSLLKMARNGLLPDLRASIHKAQKQGRAIRKERVKFAYDGEILEVAVEVIPLSSPETEQSHFLILFHEAPPPPAPRAKETARRSKGSRGRAKDDAQQEAGRLEQELATTKETLQTIIEEYESTNEELRAASEEVQSANEELQSTNEELETAKEELQSTNEELTTLNEELENRNDQLTQAIDDLDNLLNSVDIPMLILDGSLRIRRLTPTAERILKLIPADVGRPICDLRLGLEVESLKRQIREVIDTLGVVEEVVRRDNGRWYAIRIRPYRTTDNRIAGAVLAFIDITERKLAEDAVEDGRLYAESIVATVREPLLVLDDQLRIVSANHAFYTFFQTGSAETEKRLLYDLGGGEWDIPRLRELLEEIPKDAHFHDFEVDHHFPRIGRKRMLLNARRIDQTGQRPMLILLAMEEAADRERGEG
jgi:two-component system CheB/CheR fusion protein